ncbi:MAG: AIR synthase-related protein, partial [Dehalococcoidia bacterium]
AVDISAGNAKPGDKVILSGYIGDHGMAIMIARGGIDLETDIASDTAPLSPLVKTILQVTTEVHCLKDATRGGVVSVLNEIARHSDVAIVIDEASVPVRDEVRAACEILGIDPLYVANEGKLVAVVDGGVAEEVLAAMRQHPYGQHAQIVGEVRDEPRDRVLLHTPFGGSRVMDMLVGDPLPRIC